MRGDDAAFVHVQRAGEGVVAAEPHRTHAGLAEVRDAVHGHDSGGQVQFRAAVKGEREIGRHGNLMIAHAQAEAARNGGGKSPHPRTHAD